MWIPLFYIIVVFVVLNLQLQRATKFQWVSNIVGDRLCMIIVVVDNMPLPQGNNGDTTHETDTDDVSMMDAAVVGMNRLWTGDGGQHLHDSLNLDYHRIYLEKFMIISKC